MLDNFIIKNKPYGIFVLSGLFVICLLFSIHVNGQQRAQFSQYMINPYVFNPAFGGTEDFTDITLGFRSQWSGFEGAPNTIYATAHTALGKEFSNSHGHHKGEHKGWHGVGGYVYGDYTGPTSRSGAMVSYSYNLPLARKIRMSMGLFVGLQQFAFKSEGLVLKHESDGTLTTDQSRIIPDADVGVMIYSKDFFIGLTTQQLMQPGVLTSGAFETVAGGNSVLNRHLMFQGGWNVPVGYDYTLVPQVMLKYVAGAPASIDFTVMFKQKESDFFGGVSLRNYNALVGIVGVTLTHKWAISYSYDMTFSTIRRYSYGSHELVLSYKLAHKNNLTCPSRFWSH